jgi:hypothetical protein
LMASDSSESTSWTESRLKLQSDQKEETNQFNVDSCIGRKLWSKFAEASCRRDLSGVSGGCRGPWDRSLGWVYKGVESLRRELVVERSLRSSKKPGVAKERRHVAFFGSVKCKEINWRERSPEGSARGSCTPSDPSRFEAGKCDFPPAMEEAGVRRTPPTSIN